MRKKKKKQVAVGPVVEYEWWTGNYNIARVCVPDWEPVRGTGLNPGWGRCVVFLGIKRRYSTAQKYANTKTR